ncbi:hypothetical protein [Allokutzneria albata]|uniref:hypothetical protein n=1 Tax=Allokutzneria albata TaxID=211114 RepID=UPI0004C2FACD|nr:hypothetical protein [Allokutzneria albata]
MASVPSVEALLRLVGREPSARASGRWPDLEQRVGFSFPEDYKQLASALPSGCFNNQIAVRFPPAGPADTDSYLAELADNSALAREAQEAGDCPYPVYPDPGGLIFWGSSLESDTFFWRPVGDDPDQWTVVVCDPYRMEWEEHETTMSAFLLGLVTGELSSDVLGDSVPTGNDATFTPFTSQPAESEAQPLTAEDKAGYWRRSPLPSWSAEPAGRFADLRELVGGDYGARPLPWEDIEREFGFVFPQDYRKCLEHFGPGDFRGIRLMAPRCANLDYDLGVLLQRMRATADQRSPATRVPFYPEPGGAIAWGTVGEHHVLLRAPMHEDPQKWNCVMTGWEIRSTNVFEHSITGLIYGYLTKEGGLINALPGARELDTAGGELFRPA